MGITYQELNDFPGKVFSCSCGKKHKIDIDQIVIEKGAVERVADLIRPYQAQTVFLIADSNTYNIAGKAVEQQLLDRGITVQPHVFETEGQLVPNEKSLADLVLSIPAETDLVIAVGSGTINDLSRYMAYKLNIPYVIVATAPSMDGSFPLFLL